MWARGRVGSDTVASVTRRAITQWKHRQYARATYAALRGLDARVLRDLGFHRSELMSIAAEMAGAADATRIVVRHSRGF